MPQFDFTVFSPQLVWLVLTFGLLYFVMARLALPRVGEVLEERQTRIDGDLEQAEKLKAQSEQLEQDYEARTSAARAEAVAHLKAEQEKIQNKINAKRMDMATEVEKKILKAEGRIAKAKETAMRDVEDIAVEACTAIVGQLSGQKLTVTAAKKAIAEQTGQTTIEKGS